MDVSKCQTNMKGNQNHAVITSISKNILITRYNDFDTNIGIEINSQKIWI